MHDVSSNGSFAKVQSILNDEEEKVVPYIRSSNVGETFLNTNNLIKISDKAHKKLPLSKTNYLDIMMARKGKIGGATIIMKDNIDFNCNENVIKITIKDKVTWNPYYLTTFFNSVYGKKQLERQSTGNVQPWVSIYQIKKLNCVKGSKGFQEKIEKTILVSYDKWQNSEKLYTQAQNLLDSELGLENFNPSSEKVYIKTLKESFLKTGRLDSEYYQPKYEIFDEKISNIGVEKLENICSLINYGTVPTSPYVKNNKSIPYIKGMNLKNCFIVGELDEIESTEELQDKFFTKENDIIISQMGTVGDVGVVTKEQENYLFASFTIRVRLNDERFNPYFVGAYIQNVAKDFYLYRNIAQASVRQNTDLPTIKNMPIPLVKKEAQEEIANYIKQSMEYSKKAKELLEISTKSVEIAIDKDEQTAQNFLDRQTLIAYYNE